MKARMQELLGLLTMVVERVRAANERTERAEGRATKMSLLLDALTDENEELRADLDRAERDVTEARDTILSLRDQVEAGERLADALETRAAAAELRIHRAADALGLPGPTDLPLTSDEAGLPSAALH